MNYYEIYKALTDEFNSMKCITETEKLLISSTIMAVLAGQMDKKIDKLQQVTIAHECKLNQNKN